MEIFSSIDDIQQPFKNAAITIGNFDGVHIGHRALFQKVLALAKEMDGTSVAVTFHPHPVQVLKKKDRFLLITLHEQKVELISQTGMDVLVCVPFTKQFSDIPAKQFVEDTLIKRMGMRAIVVGKDYTFGRNREGTPEFLQSCSKSMGFEVHVIDWVQSAKDSGSRMSSTRIRQLLEDGRVDEVCQLLGRPFQIRGEVVSGRNRGGKVLGFPTANIQLQETLCPKTGVYAVMVQFREKQYKAVANIGYSPTFDDHLFTIEIHILDFSENILGETLKVDFVKRIRDEIKFAGIAELAEQINKDIQTAKRIFS